MLLLRKPLVVWMFLLAAGLLTACTATHLVTTRRVVGLLPVDRMPELEVLQAPASGTAHQPLTVTVITYGSSSCTTIDAAQVDITGLTATITPFDRNPTGEVACTDDLAPHPRQVQLTFDEPGEATIRVIGRSFDGAPTAKEQTITINP